MQVSFDHLAESLVHTVGRAFYTDTYVIVLDALIREKYIIEEELVLNDMPNIITKNWLHFYFQSGSTFEAFAERCSKDNNTIRKWNAYKDWKCVYRWEELFEMLLHRLSTVRWCCAVQSPFDSKET